MKAPIISTFRVLLCGGFFLILFSSLTGSALAANNRFVLLKDGTVQDHKTGLIWAPSDNGANISWSNAIAYCKNYAGGGHHDWRMPVASELESLYGHSPKVKGKDYSQAIDVITPAISISAPWIWTAIRKSKNDAVAFGFNYGTTRRFKRGTGGNRRALPVRTPMPSQTRK